MPKDDFEFEGTGHKGAEFEKKGMQERNLDILLEKLGSKKISQAIENFADIDDDEWSILRSSTNTMLQVANKISPSAIDTLVGTVQTYIDDKIDAMINKWIAPYLPAIFDTLNNIIFPIVDGIVNSIDSGFQAMQWAMGNSTVFGDRGLLYQFGLIQDQIRRALAQKLLMAGYFAEDTPQPETQQDVRNLIPPPPPPASTDDDRSIELPKNYG